MSGEVTSYDAGCLIRTVEVSRANWPQWRAA